MRTVKWSALLSGLCGFAVVLGVVASSAHAIVTTERGASILAFPKVITDGSADTIIQITNISNSMVHARCFYVDASPDAFGNPRWQVTDFQIWLTKQQPTSWQVGRGRFTNPTDVCQIGDNGLYIPSADCAAAGLDPGAVPPVTLGFTGELKCVEVDVSNNPVGGNHLKGEATIKTFDGDTAKYNAIGFQGTQAAGSTGNELLLDQPSNTDDVIGEYDACPNELIVNHFSELSTDPVIQRNGAGGRCDGNTMITCITDADCGADGPCAEGPAVAVGPDGVVALRSANLTELTLIPCTQNFEETSKEEVAKNAVTVQFAIYNEFEQVFSFSTTVECWEKYFLFQLDSPNNPERSVWSYNNLQTLGAQTRIKPIPGEGGVIGVAGILRADNNGTIARTLMNIHMVGDQATDEVDGPTVDRVILSGQ